MEVFTILLRVPNAPVARWPKHIKARHRIQRAFHDWYRVNRSRLLLDLDFVRHSSHVMEFGFAGIDRRIIVALRRNDLSVFVWGPEDDRKEECFDMLISYDAAPKRVPGGYICERCNPETRLTLPTREAVWEGDLFEPFLTWVNECLAPATALHCHVSDSFTYATFAKEPIGSTV
jgi:hypothetical protein